MLMTVFTTKFNRTNTFKIRTSQITMSREFLIKKCQRNCKCQPVIIASTLTRSRPPNESSHSCRPIICINPSLPRVGSPQRSACGRAFVRHNAGQWAQMNRRVMNTVRYFVRFRTRVRVFSLEASIEAAGSDRHPSPVWG